jgi:hypothetical protein
LDIWKCLVNEKMRALLFSMLDHLEGTIPHLLRREAVSVCDRAQNVESLMPDIAGELNIESDALLRLLESGNQAVSIEERNLRARGFLRAPCRRNLHFIQLLDEVGELAVSFADKGNKLVAAVVFFELDLTRLNWAIEALVNENERRGLQRSAVRFGRGMPFSTSFFSLDVL